MEKPDIDLDFLESKRLIIERFEESAGIHNSHGGFFLHYDGQYRLDYVLMRIKQLSLFQTDSQIIGFLGTSQGYQPKSREREIRGKTIVNRLEQLEQFRDYIPLDDLVCLAEKFNLTPEEFELNLHMEKLIKNLGGARKAKFLTVRAEKWNQIADRLSMGAWFPVVELTRRRYKTNTVDNRRRLEEELGNNKIKTFEKKRMVYLTYAEFETLIFGEKLEVDETETVPKRLALEITAEVARGEPVLTLVSSKGISRLRSRMLYSVPELEKLISVVDPKYNQVFIQQLVDYGILEKRSAETPLQYYVWGESAYQFVNMMKNNVFVTDTFFTDLAARAGKSVADVKKLYDEGAFDKYKLPGEITEEKIPQKGKGRKKKKPLIKEYAVYWFQKKRYRIPKEEAFFYFKKKNMNKLVRIINPEKKK
ncbi:MAG: hypothetical protein KAT43_02435 [Nanoarchaeota archaeon]|nr:hypothetical protein [Nanoarchaeota archaeon]